MATNSTPVHYNVRTKVSVYQFVRPSHLTLKNEPGTIAQGEDLSPAPSSRALKIMIFRLMQRRTFLRSLIWKICSSVL